MQNQELIPVFTGTLAGVPTQLVDARTLHIFLEVGKDFSTWLKSRIKQYDFQENQDYIRIEKKTSNTLPKIGDGENQGFQPIVPNTIQLSIAFFRM
jgi:phage anti-repressor protein